MQENQQNRLIWIVSLVVTLLVALMYFMPKPTIQLGFDIKIIPFINAILNALVSIFIIVGFYFIKQKNIPAHKRSMWVAFGLSCIFLVLYVVYHTLSTETKLGDVNHDGVADAAEKAALGAYRYIYYFLLLTHIVLAAVILPFILITLSRALSQQYDKHRKIAKITLPIWLYVTVTGVIVYFMIAPYY